VGQNIWLGDTGLATDSTEIHKAAKKAGADTFIQKLPQGYETALGRWFDNGEELKLGRMAEDRSCQCVGN
jgi:ATP-binding cassette subfamily B protein